MTSPDPLASPSSPPPPAGVPPVAGPARPTATPAAPVGVARPPQAGIVAGIILIVIGGAFLVARLADLTLGADAWPLWIVIPGLAMLAGSLAIPPRGGLGLAIPGALITMVGLVLWVQASYDVYATWAYAWALVAPTGPGIGMLVYGLARRDRELTADGTRTTLVGLGLFLGFALFFEGVIGLSGNRVAGLDEVLPYVVIGLGALMVVLSLVGGRGTRRQA
jgi:hypothetical protein